MGIKSYIRTEKAEKIYVGFEVDKSMLIICSDSEELQDQESAEIMFKDLLLDSKASMFDDEYKRYCKELIKLIKSTYKN